MWMDIAKTNACPSFLERPTERRTLHIQLFASGDVCFDMRWALFTCLRNVGCYSCSKRKPVCRTSAINTKAIISENTFVDISNMSTEKANAFYASGWSSSTPWRGTRTDGLMLADTSYKDSFTRSEHINGEWVDWYIKDLCLALPSLSIALTRNNKWIRLMSNHKRTLDFVWQLCPDISRCVYVAEKWRRWLWFWTQVVNR